MIILINKETHNWNWKRIDALEPLEIISEAQFSIELNIANYQSIIMWLLFE